ncbi:uncharacterized protein LOC117299085 isoform X2 [Asterias rubens]|uniref:uncharacterized protein LOC117299085 isoform X2 n=1 Tax=Asterias rubens TaxID=7604 RepID=UPI0014553C2F|nr:uncharacterized protein LOC117299085 isoform X2 [Asterias rubens]
MKSSFSTTSSDNHHSMLPVTRIPATLVLLFTLVHIHARHTTILPGVPDLSDTKMSYKYIDKLSLSNDHRREIQEILQGFDAQHEKLLAEYQAEKYRPFTIGLQQTSEQLKSTYKRSHRYR